MRNELVKQIKIISDIIKVSSMDVSEVNRVHAALNDIIIAVAAKKDRKKVNNFKPIREVLNG